MPFSTLLGCLARRLRHGGLRTLVAVGLVAAAAWGHLPVSAQAPAGALTLTISGPTGRVQMGSRLVYAFVVGNQGGAPLTNVTVGDALTGLRESLATLAPGATVEFRGTYQVTEADVPADLPPGASEFALRNLAEADSDQTDPVTAAWSVNVEYWFSASRAVVGLAMACPATARVGEAFPVGLTVRNIGDVPLAGVRVTADALGLNETLPELAVGAAGELSALHAAAGEADLPGPLVLEAAAWSERAQRVTARCEVALLPAAAADPCERADVSVIVEGAGPGAIVRVWVGGTEQQPQATAPNARGETQASWTFYPPEGASWEVRAAVDLPPGLDPARWEVTPLGSPTVTLGRCEQRVITMRVVDKGAPADAGPGGALPGSAALLPQPGGVQPAPVLPHAGAYQPSRVPWPEALLALLAGFLLARRAVRRRV